MVVRQARVLAVLAPLALVAACGGGAAGSSENAGPAKTGADLVASAKKEGRVVIYHASGLDETRDWAKGFTEKYGIEVAQQKLDSYPMFEKFQTEMRAGRGVADLLLVTDPIVFDKASNQKLLLQHVSPDDAKFADNLKKTGQYYPLYTIPMGVAYNPKKVSPEEEQMIQSDPLTALADPRWKGRYGTAAITSGGTNYVWWYNLMKNQADKYGDGYLKKLAANKPDVYDSKVPLFERLVGGEYAIADVASDTVTGTHYLKGAPIRWAYPNPTPAAVAELAISAKAPHSDAARLFMDWATSLEGQQAWQKYREVLPAHKDAVDQRKVAKETWYKAPQALYLDWTTDPDFEDDAKRTAMFTSWSTTFHVAK